MSREQLGNAQQEVLRRFHPKDIVALFSVRYHIVTDIERPFASYSRKEYPWLLGGTDPREELNLPKNKTPDQFSIRMDGFWIVIETWLMN